MTDNEIIKALEEWIKELKEDYKRLQLLGAPMDCFEESHIDNIRILSSVLDLINRKDAEIDKCHKQLDELKFLESRVNSIKNTSKDTFTGILLTIAEGVGFQEAVEEFEKRLKGKALTTIRGGQLGVIDCYDIEKIAKEMVGKS